jgi:hypothetical protein
MIIGVNGKINSGKSMVCQILRDLADRYGKRVEIKSFAYPIYRVVSDLVGVPIGEIKNKKKNHEKVCLDDVTTTYRSIMQTIGNGLREYGYHDIWLDSLFGVDNQKVSNELTWVNDWWIIEDLRYDNEAQRIKSLGGYVFQVRRNESEDNSHIAENSLLHWSDWDMVIENNYSGVDEAKAKIYLQLDEFVKEVLYGD